MIYAVGDIHGQDRRLAGLLGQLQAVLLPEDSVVFMGDYIDRGPGSAEVVEAIFEFELSHPKCMFLRGNHEQMMLDARRRYDANWNSGESGEIAREAGSLWFANGGASTLQSYRRRFGPVDQSRWWEAIPDDHWEFFQATEMEWQSERYHFVHAGVVPPGGRWDEPEYDARLWIREPFIRSNADFGKIVVFGHTPFMEGRPKVFSNKIGIDTGAAYGGPLTCIGVDDDRPFNPDGIVVLQS